MSAVGAGIGIGVASGWMCRRELAAGAVVQILAGFPLAPAELFALLPAGRRTSVRVKALLDFLAASFLEDLP